MVLSTPVTWLANNGNAGVLKGYSYSSCLQNRSEMNRIEDQWHQLKTHEIAGRMFEDEYDLALAIMDGMEARSIKGGYTLERFKFNST